MTSTRTDTYSRKGARLLAAWLKKRGVSQADLARRLGWSPLELNHYLKGRRLPGLAHASELERVTGHKVPCGSWLIDA